MRNSLLPYFARPTFSSNIWDEVDQLFEGLSTPARAFSRSLDVPVDVSETDQHYLLSVDLPGMKREDIKIEMDQGVLTISGERHGSKSDTQGKIQRVERTYGKFQRSFSLPTAVNSEKIEAHYNNGVLELTIPKAESAKPRLIEVQSKQ